MDEFIFTLIYIIPSGVEDEVVFDIKFLKFLNTFIFPKMAVVKPSKIYIDVLHIHLLALFQTIDFTVGV